MSKINDFYVTAISNADSRKRIEKILGGNNFFEASDEQLFKIGELAKNLGFDINIDEARDFLCSDEKEIGDDELDSVAGGKNQTHYTEVHMCEVGGQAGYDDDNTEFTVHNAY